MKPDIKFYEICKALDITFPYYLKGNVSMEHYLFIKNAVHKAYKLQNKLSFEEMYLNCSNDIINKLYYFIQNLSNEPNVSLHLIKNAFNKEDKHYGCKFEGHWFFISHSNNQYSIQISKHDFKSKFIDDKSFLTHFKSKNPQIIQQNVGWVKTKVLVEYINKFLK